MLNYLYHKKDILSREPRGGVEHSQLVDLLATVEGVVLVDMRDRWVWSKEASGDFTVASVRKWIDDKRLPEVSTKTRWIKAMPIKVNVHAWKVRLDCLPTRLNISRRGMDIGFILCPICDTAVESSRHIFFNCNVAKESLRKIARWWCSKVFAIVCGAIFGYSVINASLARQTQLRRRFLKMLCRVLFIGVIIDVRLLLVEMIG
ncbi:RNA-directed DNA polymerase, eukaryota [Tanacetum coccineum]